MKILRPAKTLRDTYKMMLACNDNCIVDLSHGMRMALKQGEYFALSREGHKGPSSQEIHTVCTQLKGLLDIDPMQAQPATAGNRCGVKWNLVQVKLEDLIQ